uniref:F-box domain-containing protein n=1 Tax=Mycena chlorophos TaxID=658473 RepID=A0ABQ0L5V7_MYCCL|nr:predicted protein [Mycena chlorophos]
MSCCPHCPLSVLEEVLLAPLPDLSHFDRIGAMSDAEASVIHATIANTETWLETLGKQILNAGSLLGQLKERQKELEDSLRAQKSLLAPIRKLPVDVLGEIFLVAERSSGNDSLDDFVLSRRPRDIISRVCAGWRAVASSTPGLWSRIEFTVRPRPRLAWSTTWTIRDLISQQLEWSGNHPTLSKIYSSPFVEDGVFDLILAEAHRWRDVRLSLARKDLQLLSSASRDFPLLERLDFAQLGQLYPSRQALPPLSFDSTHCPLLRDVHFQPGAYPTHPAMIPVTWSQIQWCTVTTWTDSVLPALRLLSANVAVADIKRLQVSSWAAIDDLEWYLGEEPIHMPHLLDLKIEDVRSGGRHALEFIRAPAMQSLSLVDRSGPAAFAAFVTRSRCTLTRLHLTIPLHLAGIVRALRQVPEILHLGLERPLNHSSGPPFDDEFFVAMNDATLVPAVTHLSLTGEFYCEAEDALVMLRARNHKTGAGKLRSLELGVHEISDYPFEYWQLLVLEDEGLEISYHTID